VKEGCIIYDAYAARPDIRYRDGTYYGGLHCGNTLEVFVRGNWEQARLEYSWISERWFFYDINNIGDIFGLPVRM